MRYVYALEADIAPEEATALSDLMEAEKKAAETGDFDEAHQVGKVILEEENKEKEEPEPDTGEASPEDTPQEDTDPSATEAGEEPLPEEDKSAEPLPEPETKDGKKQTPVTESLRSEYYDRIILESFDDGASLLSKTGQYAWSGAKYLGSKLFDATVALKELGVEYGPGVLSRLKKGVIYLFVKTTKLVLKTIVAVSDRVKRHFSSFSRSQKQVTELKERLNALIALETPLMYRTTYSADNAFISWLTANGKTDPVGSAVVMHEFMRETIGTIDKDVSFSIQSLKRLIELSAKPITGNPLAFLNIPPISGRYLKKTVEGHVKNPDLVDSYVYSGVLPDHILFVSVLPKQNLKTIEEITEAYRESSLFLTTDSRHPPSADKVDYMDLRKLHQFLDTLEAICRLGMDHAGFYQKIEKAAMSLKFGYRHYYQTLTQSPEQATVRSSLVEYVYLKQSFVSKVYLPAAMDIHDYTAAYLVRALRFAKENIDALRIKPTESTD